jgi:hypothetical protein
VLTVKGHRGLFLLADGREVSGSPLLHDDSGVDWPSSSILVVRIFRDDAALTNKTAQRYYGDGYDLKKGHVFTPTKRLSSWKAIGPVREVFYTRPGNIKPGPYRHPFDDRRLFGMLPAGKSAMLYELGEALRLELPPGGVWDRRGIH